MTSRGFAEFVFENLGQDGMGAVYYRNGDACTRQVGSWGTDEDEIVVEVLLGFEYWSDAWYGDYLYEYDKATGARRRLDITDEQLRKDIILTIGDEIFGYWI